MKQALAFLAAAASLAAALAVPAGAVPASAAPAASQRLAVSYGDLNLTTAEGQETLQRRLDSAAWKVCRFDDGGMLRSAQDHGACYRAARKDVTIRMAQITADQQRGG